MIFVECISIAHKSTGNAMKPDVKVSVFNKIDTMAIAQHSREELVSHPTPILCGDC